MSKKNNRDMLKLHQYVNVPVTELDQNSRTYRRLVKKGKINK